MLEMLSEMRTCSSRSVVKHFNRCGIMPCGKHLGPLHLRVDLRLYNYSHRRHGTHIQSCRRCLG